MNPHTTRFASLPPLGTPTTATTASTQNDPTSSPTWPNVFASRLASPTSSAAHFSSIFHTSSSSSFSSSSSITQGQRLGRYLFQGIPQNYPVRAKIRIKLDTSRWGMAWDTFQALASILSCIFYVMSTYQHLFPAWVDWFLTVTFTSELALRYFVCEDRWAHTFEFFTIIDWLTVLPMYVQYLVWTAGSTMGGEAAFFFVRLARTMNIMRTFRFAAQRNINKTTRQYFMLGLTVLSLVFLSAGIVQIVEENMTFGLAVYFMIVTMSTVGYGDIHPKSPQGRLVVSLIIITCWILVPLEISKLFFYLSSRSKYRTSVPRHRQARHQQKHVLVLGEVDDVSRLQNVVSEFYHPQRPATQRRIRLVIVGPDEPTRELKELMLNPILEGRVSYIKASVMKGNDLERLAVEEARAAFILSDWQSGQAQAEDSRAIIRTLMLNNYSPRCPVYVQLSEPHATFQLSLSPENHVLCSDSLKMTILGLSVVHPGASTLLINLLTSTTAPTSHLRHLREVASKEGGKEGRETEEEGWLPLYLEGSSYEFHVREMPKGVNALSFSEAAILIYQQTSGRVLLIGVEEEEGRKEGGRVGGGKKKSKLLCNPGPTYVLRVEEREEEVGKEGGVGVGGGTMSAITHGSGRGGKGGKEGGKESGMLQGIFLAANAEELERLHWLTPKSSGSTCSSSRGSSDVSAVARLARASSQLLGLEGRGEGGREGGRRDEIPVAKGKTLRVRPDVIGLRGEVKGEEEGRHPSAMGDLEQEKEQQQQQQQQHADLIHSSTSPSSSPPSPPSPPFPSSSSSPSSFVSLPSFIPLLGRPAESAPPPSSIPPTSSLFSPPSSPPRHPPSSTTPLLGIEMPQQQQQQRQQQQRQQQLYQSPLPRLPPSPTYSFSFNDPGHRQCSHLPSSLPSLFSSMGDYLASLAAHQECLSICPGGNERGREGMGVRRESLSTLRQMEGHMIVVCHLANLPCLEYFLAPLRQEGREGGEVDQPVVIIVSLAGEEGSGREGGKEGNVVTALNGKRNRPNTTPGGGGGRRRQRGVKKVIESLRRFGPLHLMEGDATTDVCLQLAGLGRAQSCVMMADKGNRMIDGHLVDNSSLRRFLSVQKFMFEAVGKQNVRADFRFVCEVQNSSTLKIMSRYQEKIKTASRDVLLHSLRELSFHPSLPPSLPPSFQLRLRAATVAPTAGRVTSAVSTASATASVGRLPEKPVSSFLAGDELESHRPEVSNGVHFGVKEVYLCPFFASGKGFLTHIFDTLQVQFYYAPVVTRFVQLLVGHVLDVEHPDGPWGGRGPSGGREGGRTGGGGRGGGGGGGGQLRRIGVPRAFLTEVREREKAKENWAIGADDQSNPRVDERDMGRSSSRVNSSCSLDDEEEEDEEAGEEEDDVGKPTFGVFVRYMLRTRGLLPIALHRYCPSSLQHYVVTMPRASLCLHPMDYAYVLTPVGPLTPQQEKVTAAAEAAAETAAA